MYPCCGVDPANRAVSDCARSYLRKNLPEGTKVRLRISHAGTKFISTGRVAYSRPGSGMGIAFLSIEPSSQSILDAWLTHLR